MAWQSNLDAHCTTAHIGCLSVLMAVVGPSRRLAATQQPRRFDIKADITFGTHAARFMMGWTPRPTASMCQSGGVEHHLREASVSEVIIIGLDIAKHVFHAHGADGKGRAIFSKRISRGKLLDFFAAQPSCTVALETCGGAHHWARQVTQLGHEVRLIPPAYVKPFGSGKRMTRSMPRRSAEQRSGRACGSWP